MPNKIKTNPETPIIFMPTGSPVPTGVGMPTATVVNFNPDALSSNVGRISLQQDLGPGPRTTMFEWRGKAIPGSGTAVGDTVEIYVCTSNSVAQDGNLPKTEGPVVNADKRRNLQVCGSLVVDSGGLGTSPEPMIGAGVIEIFGRYISAFWWNNTGLSLGSGNYLILTPIPDEIQ
jgi:hypothetical protein